MIENKKAFLTVLFITVLGCFFRLLFIDKAEGLWNDEYVSWSIASIPIGQGIFKEIFAQCHMPLYYFYLKSFMFFGGDSDLFLRLTSVLPAILSIISMYFVGKEFKDSRLGLYCAFFTSISSFLIYFSQEVRFYSLLFFFASLLLLFSIKLLRNQKICDLIGFGIFSLLIILTHTIGFVFVLLNALFVAFYISKTDKDLRGNIYIALAALFIVILSFTPFILRVFFSNGYSQWWGNFTFSKVLYLMTDYFSPKLVNVVGAPDSFLESLKPMFFIFGCIPAIISLFGVIKSLLIKNKELYLLFSVSFLFLISLIIASMMGKLVFLTKYSIEIYPTLILLACFGLYSLKKKALRVVLLVLYSALSLFYLTFSSVSAPKIKRNQGHKIVSELIQNAQVKDGDFILLNYYPKVRFEKYIDFSKYNVVAIGKGNYQDYISKYGVVEAMKEGKKIFKPLFETEDNPLFSAKLNKEIVSKMQSNQKLVLIIFNNVSVYSPMQIVQITQDEKLYKKTPYLFLVFSYLKNQEIKEFLNTLVITRLEQKGSWSAITFTKR